MQDPPTRVPCRVPVTSRELTGASAMAPVKRQGLGLILVICLTRGHVEQSVYLIIHELLVDSLNIAFGFIFRPTIWSSKTEN